MSRPPVAPWVPALRGCAAAAGMTTEGGVASAFFPRRHPGQPQRDPGPDPAGAAFLRDDVMRTALMLRAAGDPVLGRRFALHLGESLGPEDMGRLGRFALEQGWTNLAVHVGKAAAGRGFILPDPYFPLSDMVPGDLPVARALALAITRRESEFDPGAISPAGARGLMQVMPRTGAERFCTSCGTAFL